jgi:hypothetical protein
MSKPITPVRLPYAVSKARLQMFFVNEAGTPLSRKSFRKYIRLMEFCQEHLNMAPDVFRRRKNFFGNEVEVICKGFGIDIDELLGT